ncbi:PglL family O-oligosaccharyltransferase [Undibacterium oligocarboniphilum]|uniref:O-antigen ligase C-terminal domain-containing protein n=1 Tax=Undibacterium oligocarboniphilum TaxID=666702 RepID=A0A850QFW6_9BURK|nr:O-antigen ligase family protein [Undibacterium oligocarboniphilum]MBC3870747.1 O-antigen ligase C-terminal domain-containing protein [Undibacterium oligocarboniphilum]NVO78451.1 O-antigen ligase C-terminal domain-containing protein [Undibacterium oligocarboniphilum]
MQWIFQARDDGYDLLFPVMYLLYAVLALILGATLASNVIKRDSLSQTLAIVFMISGWLSVLMQIVQLLGLDFTPLVMYMPAGSFLQRPYANVAQPNQLALLLCFSLAATTYLFQQEKLRIQVAICSVVLLLAGLVLTQSRIGWIIIPLFIAILVWNAPVRQSIGWQAAAWFGCMYAAGVFLLPKIAGLAGVHGGSAADHVGGRSERIGLWRQAWDIAANHLWTGAGWFRFGSEQVHIAADFPSTTYAEHAHNIVLNLAAETGWLLTGLMVAGLFWWFYQVYIKPKKDLPMQFAGMCLVAACVHSLVEFPLWYGYVLFPVLIMAGMLHQYRWPAAATVRLRKDVAVAATAIALFCMMGITWDYQRVVRGFNILRWEQTGHLVDLKQLEQPRLTLFPQFFAYFHLMKITPAEGMSAEDIAFVEHWTPRFGFVHILNKLAEVSALNGKREQAVRAMQTLQRLHPDLYPEYFDYWKAKGVLDARYQQVFLSMPRRDAP